MNRAGGSSKQPCSQVTRKQKSLVGLARHEALISHGDGFVSPPPQIVNRYAINSKPGHRDGFPVLLKLYYSGIRVSFAEGQLQNEVNGFHRKREPETGDIGFDPEYQIGLILRSEFVRKDCRDA